MPSSRPTLPRIHVNTNYFVRRSRCGRDVRWPALLEDSFLVQIHLRVDSRIAVVSFGIINLFPFYSFFIRNACKCRSTWMQFSLLIKEKLNSINNLNFIYLVYKELWIMHSRFFLIKKDITTRDDCILNINLKHTF